MRGPGCWLLPLPPPPLWALLGASAVRTRRRWDLSRGAETHAAAGGSAGPSRPAQPEVSVRRRDCRAGAAGKEAGLGHLSGRRLGLPSARRLLSFLSRGRAAGWVAGEAGAPGRSWGLEGGEGWVPPSPAALLSCCCPSAGKRRLRASRPSPRRGPRKPDAVLRGAGSADSGGLSLSVTCPLARASPLPRLDAAASL